MDPTSDSNKKEILALGQTTMLKFQKLKIIVYGLQGLGVEIIKNIGEYKPSELLVLDDILVQKQDLQHSFIYKNEHISKTKRQELCLTRFKTIFDDLNIKTLDDWRHEHMLIAPNIVNKYDLIVITAEYDINKIYKLNEFCREQKRQIGLIYGQTLGAIAMMINDFGQQFKVYDKNGIEPSPFLISNISKSQQGVVTINQEKKHNFKNGDFVRIFDVEGMVEVNGTDTRPIRVIDDYSFSIEDTREFSDYLKGGFVEVAKVPFKITFKTIQQSFQDLTPILSFQEQFNRQFLLNYKVNHVQDDLQILKKLVIQKVLEFYQKEKRLPTNEEDSSQILAEIDSNIENKKEIVDKICQFANIKTIMMSQHLGSIMSMEILKYTGKFQPIRGFFQFDILELVQNDWQNKSTSSIEKLFGKDVYQKLMDLKLTLVGGGTTGIEIGKALALMELGSQNGKISILDQDVVKANNIKTHFYFNKASIGTNKAEIVKSEMLKLNAKLNVQSYKQKIGLKMYQLNDQNNKQSYKEWQDSDYILGALDKERSTNFLIAKCIQSQQKLIISNAYNFKCQFQMVVPNNKYNLDQRDSLYGISSHKEQETQRDVVMIPFLQEQLIQWAHKLFQSIFDNTQKLFRQIKQNKLQQLLIDDLRNDLESRVKMLIVNKILNNNYQLSNQQKVSFGIELFHYLFVNQIEELIQKYPQDSLTKDGQLFWSGYRRFPTLLEYDITDESFVNFVGSCVNMLSIILDQENSIIQDKQNLIHLIKMQYLVLQNNEYEWNFIKFTQYQMEEILTEIQNLKINAEFQEKIKTKQINLDENLLHKNQFLDFMTSATNLKAKCFYLQEIPRYKMEKITFNMNNNVILVHSYIASHTIFQLLRMLQNKYWKSGEFSMIDNTSTYFDAEEDEKQWQYVLINEQMTIHQIQQTYCEDQKMFLMNLEDINVYNHNEKIDYLTEENQNLTPNNLFQKLTGINIFEQKDHLTISLITKDQSQNTKCHPIYRYLKQ